MISKNSLLVFLYFVILIKGEKVNEEKILSRQKRALFYPQFTVLQINVALVSQISYITSHRVAINSGFAMSYGLPFKPSQFYDPIYWARSNKNETSLIGAFFNRMIESSDDDNEEEVTESATEAVENDRDYIMRIAKRDVSAGEFYHGIKEALSVAGYHEECLLKCVCELAKHPLVEDNDNLMAELLHFVLTPSVHKAFDGEDESDLQKAFEDAEMFGNIGGDCDLMYDKCETSPLHKISNFVEFEE